MLRQTKAVTYADGREAIVRELTVTEADQLLAQDGPPTFLDQLLDQHHCTASLLSFASGVSVEELEALTPSAYAPLIQAVREVNPDFFAMARQVADRARQLDRMLAPPYGAAPVSLSQPAIPTPGTMG